MTRDGRLVPPREYSHASGLGGLYRAEDGGISTPPANTTDLSIERDVGWIACDATWIGVIRRLMVRRRAIEMMVRGLAREGRRRCH
jgi:hypothetical protein